MIDWKESLRIVSCAIGPSPIGRAFFFLPSHPPRHSPREAQKISFDLFSMRMVRLHFALKTSI